MTGDRCSHLFDNIDVVIAHASEVTNLLSFYVDVDLGRGFEWVDFAARSTPLDSFRKACGGGDAAVAAAWSPEAISLIGRAAKLLGADLDGVADVVATKLNSKLWSYENWADDEEKDRRRMAAEEAA